VSETPLKSWRAIQGEVRRRISQREWKPGEYIPHEADLAQEFGCARATVNRALRGLAESGLLERRRRAGTRVALNPVRRAKLEIPVIRDEIEAKGLKCHHAVLKRDMEVPPADIHVRMGSTEGQRLLHLETLYTADGTPYVFEDRWISPEVAPAVTDEDFSSISPNEWLVREIPFEGGDFTFSALAATDKVAEILSCPRDTGLFVLDRTTHNGGGVITSVRLIFHPGYRLHTEI
jgi:GntR family histidine utilization transcriptional repressor